MSPDAEHPESESTDEETLARHKKIVEVGNGERQMDWSIWASFIYESKCLTPKGKEVALWSVEILKQTLKDVFFQRIEDWSTKWQRDHPELPPDSHPVFSLGLWPANDLPWVYANLIRLAARIQLLKRKRSQNNIRPVLKNLQKNIEPISWVSALLQLEVAALGLKAEWKILFEPPIGNGGFADILLTKDQTQLLVETTVMRLSEADRKTIALSRDLSMYLNAIEVQYNVRISGSLSSASLKNDDDRTQCLKAIVKAAQATVEDGLSKQVSEPNGVFLTIFRPTEETAYERWEIIGDPIGERLLERLIAILNNKNKQAEGSAIPVWVRLDESATLWQLLQAQGRTLTQIRDFFADFLQRVLVSFPYLAGVIISPGISWPTSNPQDTVIERNEQNGSVAISCSIPVQRVRETIITTQAGKFTEQARIFADWYSQESKWLSWALEKLGKPPLDELVHLSD